MYADFFGLAEPPFSLTPDPRYVFMSGRHSEGLAHLLYGIQQPGGFVQLTGEVGCGKTTLCRYLVKRLPPDTDIALILNPRLTVLELLACICDELGVRYPPETGSVKILVDALNNHLLASHGQGRRTVLLIDEAQNLQSDVLEQIRLLTNLETSKEKLLQIILVGQPELLSILKSRGLRQLSQRITARYHLLPLSKSETYAYVRHRLLVAGRREPLFAPPAMRQVYRLSGGVPRLINIICDRTLLGAYALDRKLVSAGIVRRASRETRGIMPRSLRLKYAWTASLAALAVLVIGGAYLFTTANLTRARQSQVESTRAADDTRSTAAPLEPYPAAKGDQGIANGSPHPLESRAGAAGEMPSSAPRPGGVDASALQPRTTAGNAVSEKALKGHTLPEILADPSLRGNAASSFVALYGRLGIRIPADRTSVGCKDAGEQGFDCLFQVGNWTKLRYFDLPAILELTLPSGSRQRALLVALTDETATLSIGGREYAYPTAEIDRLWTGSFIIVWHLPFAAREVGPGARGETVLWVRQALDTLEGRTVAAPDPERFDGDLRHRVMAFQRNQSLPQDGIVGSATLVRITLALKGRNAPSLSRPAP